MLMYEGDRRIAEADIAFADTLNIIKVVLVRDKEDCIEARAHVQYDGVLWMHVRELDDKSHNERGEIAQRWARDGFATTRPQASQLPSNITRALRNATRAMASLVGAVDDQISEDHPLVNRNSNS